MASIASVKANECVACGLPHVEGCWGGSMPDLTKCQHIEIARSRQWAADQARKHNAECEVERLHGKS